MGGVLAAAVALGALVSAPTSALAAAGANTSGGEGVHLYRLYNPYATFGTHHYTTDAAERDVLMAAGWRDEGTGWVAIAGREFLLDGSVPAHVRAAADALKVPDDEYVTYSIQDAPSSLGLPEGMKSIGFISDDREMAAGTYLNPGNSVDTELFFMTWRPTW